MSPSSLFQHLNDFKYFYLTQIIIFTLKHLFAHNSMVSVVANTNKSIQHCYLTLILTKIIHSFAQSRMSPCNAIKYT